MDLTSAMNRRTWWKRYLANHRTSLAFTCVLIAIHLSLIINRIYEYRNSCVWIILARICGQCLHFDCSLVLLLTMRRCITWLRCAQLDWLLPLDRHIYFHKMIGWAICFFSFLHTIAHIANFEYLSGRTGISVAQYLFDISLGIGWVSGLANPSGLAILIILIVMAIFSHRSIRRTSHFEIFYWTHLLCLPFYTLLILHGPNVWKWLLGPMVVFTLEICYRIGLICSGKGHAVITKVTILPNKVIRLQINRPEDFDFRPGDYIYANIPSVAKYEWHPFTISSAPENEDFITLHIRVAGGWTGRLYETFDEEIKSKLNTKIFSLGLSCPSSPEISLPTSYSLPWHLETSSGDSQGFHNAAFQPEYSSLQISPTKSHPLSFDCVTKVDRIITDELTHLQIPIFLDGPYGGPSTRIWNCRYTLMIAGGIGVTPFASMLQSLMARYISSTASCPQCGNRSCLSLPASLGKLKHVDFMWINRDLSSFQWFLELLSNLNHEQNVAGSVMEKFLDIQLYQTGNKPCPDICQRCRDQERLNLAIKNHLLNKPIDPVHSTVDINTNLCSCNRALQQLKPLIRHGRPVWDEVFTKISAKSPGKVTVFYCGPPAMGRVINKKCKQYGFAFRKEIS